MASLERKKVDILWLVEHVAREFDVACVIKAIAKKKYGLTVEVRNLYQHIQDYLLEFDPAVVVHPYVYCVKGALATEDVFNRWPDAIHVNAAWEQVHYKAQYKIKSPSDELARDKVIHFAWGAFYRDYLTSYGVPSEHIIINGHPAYQLYRKPYRNFFRSREELAEHYGLNANKLWIFIPENYRWAFAQKKLKFFVSMGGDLEELNDLVQFSIPSLRELLKASHSASLKAGVDIIFRPRPAVSTTKIIDFYNKEFGNDLGNIHFIKEGSVREWILASDQVVSSYSTSLLEASVAGKPAWMFEPIPIPESLHCEWYDSTPRIKSAEEFVDVCHAPISKTDSRLSSWVMDNLLPESDPIEKIAIELRDCCTGSQRKRKLGPLPDDLTTKQYFNRETHEMDEFTPEKVSEVSNLWSRYLFRDIGLVESEMPNDDSACQISNKTMSRCDYSHSSAKGYIDEHNRLSVDGDVRDISSTSWWGALPETTSRLKKFLTRFKRSK